MTFTVKQLETFTQFETLFGSRRNASYANINVDEESAVTNWGTVSLDGWIKMVVMRLHSIVKSWKIIPKLIQL